MPRPNLMTICKSLSCKMRHEITFFDLVTLTFDLWSWPPGSTSRLTMFMPWPNLRAICQAAPQIWILVTYIQTYRKRYAQVGSKIEKKSNKVVVIPKEGWARPHAPILLLVWQWLRPLGPFSRDVTLMCFTICFQVTHIDLEEQQGC